MVQSNRVRMDNRTERMEKENIDGWCMATGEE
jgi:hypothetical protein